MARQYDGHFLLSARREEKARKLSDLCWPYTQANLLSPKIAERNKYFLKLIRDIYLLPLNIAALKNLFPYYLF